MSQIHIKIDKKLKIYQFPKFFSKFLKNFVDWNVEKNVFSSTLREEINAVFQTKSVWNLHQKSEKTDNFPMFIIFFQFLSKNR